MSRTLTPEQLNTLAEQLEGTVDNEEDALSRMGMECSNFLNEFTMDTLSEFDARVFRCGTCGWWYRQDDRDETCEEWTCTDCAKDA